MEIVSAALLAMVAEGRWGASATIGEMSWLILLVAGFLSSAGVALFVYFFLLVNINMRKLGNALCRL